MLEQQLKQLREQLRIATVRLQAVTQLSGNLHQWHEPQPPAAPPQRLQQPQLPPLPASLLPPLPAALQMQRPQLPRPPTGGLLDSAVAVSIPNAQ